MRKNLIALGLLAAILVTTNFNQSCFTNSTASDCR